MPVFTSTLRRHNSSDKRRTCANGVVPDNLVLENIKPRSRALAKRIRLLKRITLLEQRTFACCCLLCTSCVTRRECQLEKKTTTTLKKKKKKKKTKEKKEKERKSSTVDYFVVSHSMLNLVQNIIR